MNRTSLFIVMMLSVIPLGPAHATRLVAASMARSVSADTLPQGVTDSFPADAPMLHMVAVFADAKAGTEVRAVWVAVDAVDVKNYEIAATTSTLQAGEARTHFRLTRPNNGWPSGNYKLDLHVDGVFVTSLPFRIVSSVARTAPAPVPSGPPPPAAAAVPPGGARSLAGAWTCRTVYMGSVGSMGMVAFDPSGVAIVNGRRFGYRLLPGNVLRLIDQSGANDYGYRLSGDHLVMVYGDGSSFNCIRGGGANPMTGGPMMRSGLAGPADQTGGYGMGGGAAGQGGGNEWQLQGTFCHYGGSSSYSSYSSYSHTERITFDGRGRWSFGSESSFSGTAGSAYGGQGNQDSGVYRVAGNRILYRTGTGEQGAARVNMRQNDGRITEIYLDGELYAPALCQ